MSAPQAVMFGTDAQLRKRALGLTWPSHGPRRRAPNFWGDLEVRGFLAATHRQMTLDEARAAIAERFGAARVPSRSAVNRFWLVLDQQGAAA
ncbi:MAG: hypothetical protein Q7V31_03555 [Parvibaculum sp.]|uniref:hypothetical protein n=1 Tax=Parvibaculum sp. TaxID=2024848 RepID=UPI002715F62E|nr:hypothetical protein [Parvibaculum sp.]MDO8837978.1 hypothetical protein [Parvibaculum sp.]